MRGFRFRDSQLPANSHPVIAVRLATEAMATRFEAVLHGESERTLRAAGEEAMAEIQRVEAALSLYRPESQIAEINRSAARTPVRVSPEVFQLLEHAQVLGRLSGGAFDITVAPLLRAWGLMRGAGRMPSEAEIEDARACVGGHWIELDADRFTVRFGRDGVMVDLGSIGKGYALDRAGECLREAGVQSALIHGGTSTALAIGRPPEAPAWRIAIEAPAPVPHREDAAPRPLPLLALVDLRDESLSVSAVWGKGFEWEGRFYGHVIDPSRGRPVEGALLAAVVLPSATESDALSTAMLVRGSAMANRLAGADPPIRCLVLEPGEHGQGYQVHRQGMPEPDRDVAG